MPRYTILWGDSIEMISIAVNRALGEGASLIGGVCIGTVATRAQFYQAVLYANIEAFQPPAPIINVIPVPPVAISVPSPAFGATAPTPRGEIKNDILDP